MTVPGAPFFFIYGQPVREIDPNFVHVERVSARRKLHGGKVQPHSHPHLHQLSLWLVAGGDYRVDDAVVPLNGPTVTWMPSGVVHGFDTTDESDAIVVSMSHDFFNDLLEGLAIDQVDALRRRPLVQPLGNGFADRLPAAFDEIEREYTFPSWGQTGAINAHLRLAAITLARLAEHRAGMLYPRHPGAALYVRFLEEIDRRFRDHLTMDDYAKLLATTPYLLNRAAREGAGMRASDIIRGRVVQEAKRLLLFTMLDAASVGFALGFEDAAHFGRHFKAATGTSPARWRREHRPTSHGGPATAPFAASSHG